MLIRFVKGFNLNWHYRSRDEALTAHSNDYIYDDRLVTFPGHVNYTFRLPMGRKIVRTASVRQVLGRLPEVLVFVQLSRQRSQVRAPSARHTE